jgi:hypothetical protein
MKPHATRRKHIVLLGVLLGTCVGGWSQDVPTDNARPVGNVADVDQTLPVLSLRFDEKDQKSIRMIAPIYEAPLQCGTDGTIYINSYVPPKFTTHELFAFLPDGGARDFNMAEIPELYLGGYGPRAWYPGKSSVGLLLTALPQSEVQELLSSPNGETQALRQLGQQGRAYIARFSTDGGYLSYAPLSIPSFKPGKIAVLDSGEFIVLGVDRVTNTPRIALVDKSGALERYIELPGGLPTESALMPASRFNTEEKDEAAFVSEIQALGFYQMVRHGGAVLMLLPGSAGPLFEIGPGGSVLTVPLTAPKGFVLDSALPSDEGLYLRFRRAGTNDGKHDDAAVWQVSEAGGVPTERIDLGDLTLWDVICVDHGAFKVIRPGPTPQQARLLSGKAIPADNSN